MSGETGGLGFTGITGFTPVSSLFPDGSPVVCATKIWALLEILMHQKIGFWFWQRGDDRTGSTPGGH